MSYVPMVAPPCRICGSNKDVFVWRDEAPEQTICFICCESAEHHDGEKGHQYSWARFEGHTCDYCGQQPPDDWYNVED